MRNVPGPHYREGSYCRACENHSREHDTDFVRPGVLIFISTLHVHNLLFESIRDYASFDLHDKLVPVGTAAHRRKHFPARRRQEHDVLLSRLILPFAARDASGHRVGDPCRFVADPQGPQRARARPQEGVLLVRCLIVPLRLHSIGRVPFNAVWMRTGFDECMKIPNWLNVQVFKDQA